MRCGLVIDRASVEYRLRDLLGGRGWPTLDLRRVVDWFTDAGLTVVEVAVAGPSAPWLGTGADGDEARRRAQRHRSWCSAQEGNLASTHPDVGFRELWGANDGKGEIGVDVAAAAGALDAVARADTAAVDLVILMAGDSDYHPLHRYAAPTPLLLTHAFTDDELTLLRRGGVPHLAVPDDDFVQFVAGGNSDVRSSIECVERGDRAVAQGIQGVRRDDLAMAVRGGGVVCSSALTRTAHRTPPAATAVLPDCGSVVVADPYGLCGRAVQSVGQGRLPTVDSVRALMESLWWEGPYAVLATVPDIHEGAILGFPEMLRWAWWSRDDELDRLADDLEEDGDPTTVVTRALLRPDRIRRDPTIPMDRTPAVRASKGLAINLLADLWMTCRFAPAVPVVLLSEHVDLVTALRLLPLSGIDTYRSVVRVGVHEWHDLELPEDGPAEVPSPYVLLVDAQLAALCEVDDGPYGGAHRRLLFHGTAGMKQGETLRVTGIDPETEAYAVVVRVRFDTDGDGIPELHRIETLAYGIDPRAETPGKLKIPDARRNRRLTVVFDHHSPCAHPVLMYRDHAHQVVEGIVADQGGNWIAVDIDDDGDSDFSAPVGHEAIDFDPGRSVVVATTGDRHSVVDPAASIDDALFPEIVRIVSFRLVDTPGQEMPDAFWTVAAESDGTEGLLVTGGGSPFVDAERDDLLLALRRTTLEGPSFVALSTPLEHLRALVPD